MHAAGWHRAPDRTQRKQARSGAPVGLATVNLTGRDTEEMLGDSREEQQQISP